MNLFATLHSLVVLLLRCSWCRCCCCLGQEMLHNEINGQPTHRTGIPLGLEDAGTDETTRHLSHLPVDNRGGPFFTQTNQTLFLMPIVTGMMMMMRRRVRTSWCHCCCLFLTRVFGGSSCVVVIHIRGRQRVQLVFIDSR